MPADMKGQDDWIAHKKAAGRTGLPAPAPATAEVMQVHDGKMHASQVTVYLSGRDAHSDRVQ